MTERPARRGTYGPYAWLLGLAVAPLLGLAWLALFGDHTAPRMPGFAPTITQSAIATVLLFVMVLVTAVSVIAGCAIVWQLRERTRYRTWPVFVQGSIPIALQFLIGALMVVFTVLA